MRHHRYNSSVEFYRDPEDFNRDTDRDFLQYCLGAALYMPAFQDFASIIINHKYICMTTMVMCFEDAVSEDDVPRAEESSINNLKRLYKDIHIGILVVEDLPLLFLRERSLSQFKSFAAKIDRKYYELVAGFVFPKFNSSTGYLYYEFLNGLNMSADHTIYGMPILEGRELALKEGRIGELHHIKDIIDANRKYVLNVRVGATDFSSIFGVRRGIDYTIYDIVTVRDCLLDVLNTFIRDNDYVVSGSVWEYFSSNWSRRYKNKFKPMEMKGSIHDSILKKKTIIDPAIDGLIRETLLDRANGFTGKTTIHPSHIRYVNGLHSVSKEEYEDATQILNTAGGVIKSHNLNKMNEIKPHTNWANRIISCARAYGVLESESDFFMLMQA